ncbi:MAG: insulinase family protein [Planctomycetota bacterium]
MPRPLALAVLAALAVSAQAGEPVLDVSELGNGLDLIVVEKHNAPLVTIEIAVKTGSFTETPDTNGLSHLYEHLFFKGNAALPTQDAYMRRVRELGISFNGTTSTERVNYFITLPSRNFAAGMEFMADAILHPLFNEDELVQERKVVIGEYDRNEATPSHYLFKATREALYGEQAYRKNPLGERHVILSATQETMYDFQSTYYLPNNAALFVVGDVNPTEVKVLTERLLGARRWASGPDPHALPREPLPRLGQSQAFFVAHPAARTVTLAATWPGPDVGRDERATFVADVWGTLCGLPSARLQRAFRDSATTNGVRLGYYTQREGGEVSANAQVRDGKVQEARALLFQELTAMAEPGYWTEQELALAKRELRIDRAYSAEAGADFSHTLSFWWASSSLDYYRRYLDAVDAVTPDELAGFVRNYVLGRPHVVGVLANQATLDGLGFPAEALLPAASGDSAAESAVSEFQVGGVQVLLRQVPGSAVSALDVYLDAGCFDLDPAQQGVDKLLLATLMDGSETLSRDEVAQRLSGLGARVSHSVNYDLGRLSLIAPQAAFGGAVELVSDCLLHPRFDPSALEERKAQLLSALNQERSDPDQFVTRLLNASFFQGHPYVQRPDGTPETLATLDADALRQRLGSLDSARIKLVLVGDLTQAEAKQILAPFAEVPSLRRLWQLAGGTAHKGMAAFTPGSLVEFEQRDIPTTYVIAKAPAPRPGEAGYPAARLMYAALRQRFWNSLRTTHALTYATSAGVSTFRANYGYLYVTSEFPAAAISRMYDEIERLKRDGVTPDELAGLVAQEETRLLSGLETAGGHANALGAAWLGTGDWHDAYRLAAGLRKVTPAAVQAAATTYLQDFHWGLIGREAVDADVLRGERRAYRSGSK